MKSEIEKHLEVLTNLKLEYIGRASNLFWFGFGEIIQVPQGKREIKKVATYHINIQCMWRLLNSDKILVGNMDVYTPKDNFDEKEIFEWEIQGSNLFDQRIENIVKDIKKGIYVKTFKATNTGDIKIYFSNGWCLEVFVDASNDLECWRVFKSGDFKSHLIITGIGIEE